jgi:hypothetical protein
MKLDRGGGSIIRNFHPEGYWVPLSSYSIAHRYLMGRLPFHGLYQVTSFIVDSAAIYITVVKI